MSNTNTKQTAQPLNLQLASQIAGALERLQELASLDVQSREAQAEIAGNHEFLANTFIQHGSEFLGAWFTLKQEYEPLLGSISNVAMRVVAIRNATQARIAAQREAEAKAAAVASVEPSNIIQLDRTIKV